MGATRNAEYYIADNMDQMRNVTWKDLVRGDDELDKMVGDSRRQNSTQSDQQFRRTSMSRDELLEQCTKQG